MISARTRLLAKIYIGLCGGCLAIGTVLCVGLILFEHDTGGKALEMIGGFFVALSAMYFVPGLIGGIGLLRGRHWARVLIIALSVLGIFAFPVGTLLGGFGLWVLLIGPDAKQYAGAPAAPPPAPVTEQPLFSAYDKKRTLELLVVAIGIGAGFVIMIGTGYRVTGDPSSPISSSLYVAAMGVFALVLAAAGWRIWQRVADHTTPQQRQAAREAQRQFIDDRNKADVLRREQTEYAANPTAAATCEHLSPIEEAMRATGIELRLVQGHNVNANCAVDMQLLCVRFPISGVVDYSEPRPETIDFASPLPAGISCAVHVSSISVVHPLDMMPDTPVFPLGGTPPVAAEPSDQFTQLRSRILPVARLIEVPSQMLPTYMHSVGNGHPHIELRNGTYHYKREDRGVETEICSTTSVDELLYYVFRDITFSMGATRASSSRKRGEDYRRGAFAEQIKLLQWLDPGWAKRAAAEHEDDLAKRPFADEA